MIDVATTGRLAKAPKLSTIKSGKSMASATIAVAGKDADAPPTWVRIVAFEDQAAELATAEPGQLVYEGALEASIWTPDRGGEPRLNLNVLARRLIVMGRIGQRAPKRDTGSATGQGWQRKRAGPRPHRVGSRCASVPARPEPPRVCQ